MEKGGAWWWIYMYARCEGCDDLVYKEVSGYIAICVKERKAPTPMNPKRKYRARVILTEVEVLTSST